MKNYYIILLIFLLIFPGCLSNPAPKNVSLEAQLESKLNRFYAACLSLDYDLIDICTYNKPANWQTEIDTHYQNTTIQKITYYLTAQDKSAWTETFIPVAQFTGTIQYKDGSGGSCTGYAEFTQTESWKIDLGKWLADN